jgi:hypothetical protein
VAARIDAAGEQLASALAEIRRRAPRARVYVIGYPAIMPDTAAGCPRWIEPLIPQAGEAPIHPNERGEQGIADTLPHTLAALPSARR